MDEDLIALHNVENKHTGIKSEAIELNSTRNVFDIKLQRDLGCRKKSFSVLNQSL